MSVPTKGPFKDVLYVRSGMEDMALELLRCAGVDAHSHDASYEASEPYGGVEVWFNLSPSQSTERVLEVANALVAVGAAPLDGVVLTPSARIRLRDWEKE